MLAGIMPRGQAGPFASAQARSRTLALPRGTRPAGGARGITVGSTEWGGHVCGRVFYGEHGGECVAQWSRGIGRYVYWIATGGGPPMW